jgi:uncharacterized protein YjiS (DUF1127 family)
MYAIFKEDRVTQPVYRPTTIGRARRLSTKTELSRATSCSADRIPLERQRQASLHQLRGFLSGMRAVLREWRQRKNGRLELARFDERMLRDIGLTRVDADWEINRPFWRE